MKYLQRIKSPGFVICCCLSGICSFAQKTDSLPASAHRKKDNIFQFALHAFSKSPSDSATNASVIHTKSESAFLPYQGMGIRHIFVKQYGFDRSFTDSTKDRSQNAGSKLLNDLHRNTRDWVIRNNIFLFENSELDAFKVADNERYLRTLEYIQDARILVNPVPDEPDSVDLMVITKDYFSITGELNNLSQESFKGSITDANVLGMGQKLQFTSLLEPKRNPTFGYEALYTKNNIANSFVNASVFFATINGDLGSGQQDEHAKYISLQRPLYSQYSHMAGAFTLGDFESFNSYGVVDSNFFKYHYHALDAWLGYNLGIQRVPGAARDRRFLSLRYFRNHFLQIPEQVKGQYFFKFDDRQAILSQFTFFKQDFYKTNYLYGFGTTEDVPYGYNIAVTGGWYKQRDLSRPYAGVDANWYQVTGKKDFIQYFFRSGGFLGNGNIQDASILLGSSIFSRLYLVNGLKIRQYFNVSYTKQFNRVGLDPLRIDNVFGIRYFSSDSVLGDQRISLHTETSFFLKYKLLGFKFAPFAFGDFSVIKPEQQYFSKSALFYSIGGGVRTRNENFVFGTIELLIAYFPRKAVNQHDSFKIQTNINLQFKYNSNYVVAPDIVQLNTDINGAVF